MDYKKFIRERINQLELEVDKVIQDQIELIAEIQKKKSYNMDVLLEEAVHFLEIYKGEKDALNYSITYIHRSKEEGIDGRNKIVEKLNLANDNRMIRVGRLELIPHTHPDSSGNKKDVAKFTGMVNGFGMALSQFHITQKKEK